MFRMTSSGYKVRGCPSSIPGWVLKKAKKKENNLYMYYISYVIYIVYNLCAYYKSYILHIYVESKGSGI